MKQFIHIGVYVCILLGSLAFAKDKKEPLIFDDVQQWRTNEVSLSDDGKWYTTRYILFDEPESKKDTTRNNPTSKIVKGYFTEHNKTDVLYVFHAVEGIKYQIPDASEPKFSSNSDWMAYKIELHPDSVEDGGDSVFIELKNLESGFTVRYSSTADYQFIEDKNYFITTDDQSLLIYNLDNRSEHYIANIGEYLVDRKSDFIAYTINSKDRRGNGIYLYHLERRITRALQTGNYVYSNLSWNHARNSLAGYKYNNKKKRVDFANIGIVLFTEINSESTQVSEYKVNEIEGLQGNWAPAVKPNKKSNKVSWSLDDARLFIKIRQYDTLEKEDASGKKEDESTVQVWHWNDKKLLSERIMEYDRKKQEVHDAIFFIKTKRFVQLSGEEIQKIIRSEGTDEWAIGTDNRAYVSDWDIYKNDLYRINLKTGEKKLIQKEYKSWYSTGIEISPDGKKAILWDGEHYWCYDFASDSKNNITEKIGVSFIDKEYDYFGFSPNYGFVGWVKDQQGVIVNRWLDLWLLPIDNSLRPQNLTKSITSKDSISFRWQDYSFEDEPEIEDRYIDLSSSNFLSVFHRQNKSAGFYSIKKGELKELIYKPASYSAPYRWTEIVQSEKSNAIIYRMGDYQNYPEAYLSNSDFSTSKKITNTNPQQERYKWGRRILIDYTNDDGVPLQGVLSIPEDHKKGTKLPMIVYSYEKLSYGLHRYPIPYLNGATVPEMMYVSQGYLFLRPDIHFNVGTPHSDMHECINAAIEKIIELGYVDEERIGYEGFSFGGHCGMYMSTQKNKFAAIAAGAGVSNLVQGFNIDIVRDGSNEQDYYMTGQGRLGADPTSNTEMYISESPVFNAKTMDTPLLLFHGTADKVVQWEHSFGFYSILRYLKKPVVFLSYRGEGHGLRKESNRLDIQRRLKEFFDHYLNGTEAKDWMTKELPYIPKEEPKDKEKEQRTLPKWK